MNNFEGESVCTHFKDKAFFRIFPDGTSRRPPFRVPDGHFLVVTDVEWRAKKYSDDFTKERSLALYIQLNSSGFIVFISSPVVIDDSNKAALIGTSEQLTSGFLVGPDVTICPMILNSDRHPGNMPVEVDRLILRGYITRGKGPGWPKN